LETSISTEELSMREGTKEVKKTPLATAKSWEDASRFFYIEEKA